MGTRLRVALAVTCSFTLLGAAVPQLAAAPPDAKAGWQLRWAPDPRTDGLDAFEFVEDDRANSHPAGQPHIRTDGENYRFTMHTVDRDKSTDRQRQEVRGASAGGRDLILLKGQTWRFTQSMYIPASLKATTSFTHIMQTKAPGTGTLPMLTMSLQRPGGVPKIQLKLTEGGVTVGSANLAPLQDRWLDMELEMTIGDAPNGRVRWILRNGATTVVDATRTGVDTFLEDRVRPKWGIYRSLGDSSGSLQDCYLLLRNLRAYEWSEHPSPPVWARHEAEDAVISRGVVGNDHRDYTGTGFVDYDDVAGSYVEWRVKTATAGRATLTFKYANGSTTTDRPMDIRVNGAMVAAAHPFKYTLSWDEWDTRTISANLVAGMNTIRATATTSAGGPSVDNVQVHLTPAAAEPPPSPRYEAENATITRGAVESNHAGYSGTGFVNYDNVAGSAVQWSVTVPAAGNAGLTIRYANGTTTNRPMDVAVNGAVVASGLAFPGTGAWATWQNRAFTAPLVAGANTIRATATTSGGGPNVDYLDVLTPGR